MLKDARGYIVVETITSFMLLVFLMLSILSLINIVAVQARIHYALTQTAQSLSMYCYTLELTGAADHLINIEAGAEAVHKESAAFKENIESVLDGLQSLNMGDAYKGGEAIVDQTVNLGKGIYNDPKGAIQTLSKYGLQQLIGIGFKELLIPTMDHYLSNGSMSGDDYLKAFHVVDGIRGLNFYSFGLLDLNTKGNYNSALLTKDGTVKITVQYDIDYSFGALKLPFKEPKLHVTQEVETKAWLGGSGEGYKKP